MSHVIRRAGDKDHARITEIRNAVRENKLGEANRPLVDNDYPWFRDNPGVWVWEEDAEILGFYAADTRDSIWALLVAPGHERRGISRALFEKAPGVLRQDGHRTAWLKTEPRLARRALLPRRWLEGDRHQRKWRADLPFRYIAQPANRVPNPRFA